MNLRPVLALALALSMAPLTRAVAEARAAPAQGTRGASGAVPPGLVDGPTAHRLVKEGVKVVDVRTPAEFAAGHVPGAVNIPFDEMPRRFAEVGPPSTPVLLYCRSGRRSGIAARTLREKGFSQLYDMQDFGRWVASEPERGAK